MEYTIKEEIIINWVITADGITKTFPVTVAFTGARVKISNVEFGCFKRTDTGKEYYLAKDHLAQMTPEVLEPVKKW